MLFEGAHNFNIGWVETSRIGLWRMCNSCTSEKNRAGEVPSLLLVGGLVLAAS